MPELYRENRQDDSDEAATIDRRFWREEISDRGKIDIGRLNDTVDIKRSKSEPGATNGFWSGCRTQLSWPACSPSTSPTRTTRASTREFLSFFVLVANPTIGSKQSGLKNSSGFVFEFSR